MGKNTWLKDRRMELSLTMKQVADYVGVSEATVSRWESGNIANMKQSRIKLLSEILQVSPVEIIGIKEEPTEKNVGEFQAKALELLNRVPEENQPFVLSLIEAAINNLK